MRGSRGPLDRRQPSGEAETITLHQIQRTEMEGCAVARGHRGEDGEGGSERASECGREGGRSGRGTKERGGGKGGGRDKETGSGGAENRKEEREMKGDGRRGRER